MINLPLASESWDSAEYAAIQRTVESGMFSMGPSVFAYEKEFAAFFGAKYALMVSSGSAANLLMVAALFFTKHPRLRRHDEVIVPAVSWSTTYYPLQQYGLKLVFVDVDPETLNLDIAKLAAAVNDRTKMILAVNLLGNPNDFDRINRIIGERDIVLLEDNCESMGAVYKKRQTGTIGLMGSFSTFFSHHISTMEGGCITTDDEELYHVLLSLRAHGWTRNLPDNNSVTGKKSSDTFTESFKFVLPGYNVRPLEMSGAIGREQLKKLSAFVKARRDNACYFQELFENHPYLIIQKEIGESSWFGFSFLIKKGAEVTRESLVAKLKNANVDVRPIVAGNFVKNDVIRFFDYEVNGSLDTAEHIDKYGFFIGNHHYSIKEQLQQVRQLF